MNGLEMTVNGRFVMKICAVSVKGYCGGAGDMMDIVQGVVHEVLNTVPMPCSYQAL